MTAMTSNVVFSSARPCPARYPGNCRNCESRIDLPSEVGIGVCNCPGMSTIRIESRKVAVTIGDFKRDNARRRKPSRAQDDNETTPKRQKRGRGRLWLILLFGFVLAIVAVPSLVSQSPLGRSLFASNIAKYGIEGSFQSVRIGWVSPLRITGVDLLGIDGGTRMQVDQIDCNATLLRIIGGLREPVSMTARGVVVDLAVGDGWSSVERDLAAISAAATSDPQDDDPSSVGSSSSFGPSELSIDIQNMTVQVTDGVTGEVSGLDQAKAEFKVVAGIASGGMSAVLSDAKTGSGEVEASVTYDLVGDAGTTLDAKFQGLPLRVASLIRRRFPVDAASVPEQIAGDLTGVIHLTGGTQTGGGLSTWSMDARPLEVRNFIASDPSLGAQVWRNSLMTISGRAVVDQLGVHGEKLRLATDFAELSLNGDFVTPSDPVQMANPVAWLTALDGTASGFVNLPTMIERLPGVVPLKPDTEIIAGVIHAEITSRPDSSGVRVVNASLRSDPIRARAAARNVVLEPASMVAAIRVDTAGNWRADECQLTSVFGTATLDGELANGRAKADIDLGRLAAMLEPLVEMPELELAGVAAGALQWSAQPGELWRLQGDGNATNLMISLPGGTHLHRPTMAVQVDASGRWAAGELQELTAAELTLRSESMEVDTTLVARVAKPNAETLWPLRIDGRGRLEVLSQFLGPWMPQSLHSLSGGFAGQAEAIVGLASGEVSGVKLKVEEPRAGWDDRLFAQSQITIDFDGQYAWPSGNLMARSITVAGESISGAAKGMATDKAIDMELAFRADLDRLQGTFMPRVAQEPSAVGQAKFASAPVAATSGDSQWGYQGKCEGNIRMTRAAGENDLAIETHVKASDFAIREQQPPGQNARPANGSTTSDVIWAEPSIKVDGSIIYHITDGAIDTKQLAIATDWITSKLSGSVLWNESQGDVKLTGPASIRMDAVAKQLSTLAGTQITLQGIHETPIDIAAKRRPDGTMALELKANLGWESGEVAGIVFGASAIPITMSETTVAIRQAVVPVDEGRITASADIHYMPGPMWMDVKPGVIAQNLRMTRELSDKWLQYLAPMVAQTTRIDGTFGVELTQAVVNLEDPMQSRVRGQLQINQVNFDAGPVTNQLLSSIQQIQMIARGRAADAGPGATQRNRNLATLPTQSVDFDFSGGIIAHQRMFMVVEKARVITSGQVHVDGNLNLVTQVPLDAEWLGSDLKVLAGQTVTLPIGGTLSRPRLDPAAIRNLVSQLGTKVIQSEAENYLEKQFNRGLERLLGK